MRRPGLHALEGERLDALAELDILDTPPEESLDSCAALAAQLCGVPLAAISLVDRERQWFKALFGSFPRETSREVSFCAHAIADDDELVVEDASMDPRFVDNPLVEQGHVRFYAGVPLRGRDGLPVGVLCVMDNEPRQLVPERLKSLREIAEHIEAHLMLRVVALRAGARARSASEREQKLAEVDARRRESIAMLVHDVKSPLAAIALVTDHLRRDKSVPAHLRAALDEVALAADAAERLVVDALDVGRSETGTLPVRFARVDMGALAARLVRRMQWLALEQRQQLTMVCEASDPWVRGDGALLARALRNLLDNAMKFAPPASAIRVRIRGDVDSVTVRVEDEGTPIPVEQRERIFDRYTGTHDREGHGLGLALCAVVADVHGGSAWVEDRDGHGNALCLRLAREAPARA